MHEWEVTIRFCETDLLGHVNNSNYFIYMEDARVQFFSDCDLVGERWNFVLASATCDFLKQVYFGQTLLLRSRIVKIGSSSFHLEQEMVDKDTEETAAKGLSIVVQYDFDNGKSLPLSEAQRSNLEKYRYVMSE
ncbi:thioesterase family protein [Halobacillus sp. ACCC02827]|uniref:acyl-CoA thioesterase n=1 Tax=unclassified Halobacillus TaxID=2636472 RepID=UPI000782AAE3|nr:MULTISPECIES: thioesterase family protein [unclassified Halobacillus]WJE16529.1 thioesterase family protein [Halobacillus sp. ACCC02827]